MHKTHLLPNQHLATCAQDSRANEKSTLVSANGLFYMVMQNDGNLVIYRGNELVQGDWVWATWHQSHGFYYAIMQADGNFCVYNGILPNQRGGLVWQSGTGQGRPVQAFVILEDDGNLAIYKGTGPENRGQRLWQSGAGDPLESFEVKEGGLVYDLGGVVRQALAPLALHKAVVENNTSIVQTDTVGGEWAVRETHSLETKWGLKITVTAKGESGVPFLAKGGWEVSVEGERTWTTNKTEETSKILNYSAKVTAEPATTVTAWIVVSRSNAKIPYVATGTAILKSGFRIPTTMRGNYVLDFSHDVHIEKSEVPHSGVPVTVMNQMTKSVSVALQSSGAGLEVSSGASVFEEREPVPSLRSSARYASEAAVMGSGAGDDLSEAALQFLFLLLGSRSSDLDWGTGSLKWFTMCGEPLFGDGDLRNGDSQELAEVLLKIDGDGAGGRTRRIRVPLKLGKIDLSGKWLYQLSGADSWKEFEPRP